MVTHPTGRLGIEVAHGSDTPLEHESGVPQAEAMHRVPVVVQACVVGERDAEGLRGGLPAKAAARVGPQAT
jgi:hypothetical protein